MKPRGMRKSETSQRASGREVRADGCGEDINLGLGEAVEEEVGHDEVEGGAGFASDAFGHVLDEGEGVGLVGTKAAGVSFAAAA